MMCAKQSSHTFLPKDRLQVPATDHACTSYVDTEKFVVPTFERTSSFLPRFQKVSPNKIYFPSNQNEVVIELTTNEAPNPNPIPNIFFLSVSHPWVQLPKHNSSRQRPRFLITDISESASLSRSKEEY